MCQYPGTCRTRQLDERPGRGLRVEMDEGVETFTDTRLGPQRQHPSTEAGDLLIRDRDGHWTYQFAVTADDIADEVTLVIRGADLLSSTGRQRRLARMLGRPRDAVFLHHPVLVDADGRKLSKSRGDTGIRDLRAAGIGAAEVIGRAAARAGLIPAAREIRAADVHELFF